MKFRLQNLIDNTKGLVRELENGLRKLRFVDNFDGFNVEVTIPATSEVAIPNQLKTVPSGYIIRFQTSGDNLITAGDTAWTLDLLYMKNHGAGSVTAKIFFEK